MKRGFRNKKIIEILFTTIVIAITVLISCKSRNVKMCVKPMSLSEEQEKIVNLLGENVGNTGLYDYNLNESVTSIEIRVKEYVYGEMVREIGRTSTKTKGKGSILLNYNLGEDKLSLGIYDEYNGCSNVEYIIKDDLSYLSCGQSDLSDIKEVERDDEIILRVILRTNNNGMSIYNVNEFMKNPQLLNEYENAIVIYGAFLGE